MIQPFVQHVRPLVRQLTQTVLSTDTRRGSDMLRHCESLYWRLGDMRNAAANQPYALGITSCYCEEGVSAIAANLAIVASRSGDRPVLLIDGNLGHPSVGRNLDLELGPGLHEALTREVPAMDFVQRTQYKNLSAVVSGADGRPRHPEHYDPTRFSQLVCDLKRRFSIIIVDLPTADELSPSLAVAGDLDGVLLVVEAQRVEVEVARQVKQRLEAVQANLLGVVVNKLDDLNQSG